MCYVIISELTDAVTSFGEALRSRLNTDRFWVNLRGGRREGSEGSSQQRTRNGRGFTAGKLILMTAKQE